MSSQRRLVACLWVLGVTLCVYRQPFRLGFYSDDWIQIARPAVVYRPFSGALFHFLQTIDQARPGMWPIKFVLVSVLGNHPAAWHIALLAVNALTAFLLMRAARLLGCGDFRVAALAGFAWMVFPWDAAGLFWPTMLAVELLMALFAAVLILAIRSWSGTDNPGAWRFALAASAAYIYLLVSYEAFYLQFVTLIALGGIQAWRGKAKVAAVVRCGIGLGCAQAVALGWYFWASWHGTQQPMGQHVILGIASDLHHLLPEMLLSLRGLALPFAATVAASVAIAAIGIPRSSRRGLAGPFLLAFAALCGGVGSIVMFSMGGRAMMGSGVESRVLSIFSFWLVLAISLAGDAIFAAADSRWRKALAVLGAAMVVLLGISRMRRANDWAQASQAQQVVLREAPVPQIAETPPEAAIVYLNQSTVDNAPIFVAPWDLNPAMELTYGRRAARLYVVYNRLDGRLTWDGTTLRYPGQVVASNVPVFLWQPGRRFSRATRPFSVDRDGTLRD